MNAYMPKGLGELIHLAVGKNEMAIVKYLVEEHNVNPSSVGEVCYTYNSLRISSKSHRTSKSRRPRNLTAPIRRLVPTNAALKISPHGKGSSDSKYAEYRHTPQFALSKWMSAQARGG